MAWLSISTSTSTVSVSVMSDSGMLVSNVLPDEPRSADALLPEIHRLMERSGAVAAAIAWIAVDVGPGMFTGLRAGCSIAKGLAAAWNCGLIGVVSLDALADQAGADRVLVAVDARMGEVYWARYSRAVDGELVRCGPIRCSTPDLIVLPATGTWVGVGSGFRAAPLLAGSLGAVLAPGSEELVPTSEGILRRAMRQSCLEPATPADELSPFYVRNNVALTIEQRALAAEARV